MQAFFVIIIAFLVVWFDIAFFSWLPVFLAPIWIWVGIHITVIRDNNNERWLWVASFTAWNLFACGWLEGLIFLIIFLTGSAILNFVYKKYLPMTSVLLTLIPSIILLALCQTAYMALTQQSISINLAGRIVVTILIIFAIILFYDPKKAKKKHIRTSR